MASDSSSQPSAPAGSTPTRVLLARLLLALLAIMEALAALWALFAPRAFYDDFPLPGVSWVSALPPFNEHLITDYGGSWLGLTALVAIAAWIADRRLMRVAAVVWLIATVPHLVFHLFNLDGFAVGDAIAQTAALVIVAAAPVGVLVALRGVGPGRP